MDKQKIRSLDEERESRNLLSNTVVVLYLVFGTLPLLFEVWAVDRLMGDTLTPAMLWSVGVGDGIVCLVSWRVLWNFDLAGSSLGL